MTSLAGARLKPVDANLEATVAGLAASAVRSLEAVPGGSNNRVYRAELENSRRVCVKCYLSQADDARDRLGVEFGALRFMTENGLCGLVPRPIAANAAEGVAIFDWVDGSPVVAGDAGGRSDEDIGALMALIGALHGLRSIPEAANLPLASEACLSGAALFAQIESRRRRFQQVVREYPDLDKFFAREFDPLLADLRKEITATYARTGFDFAADIAESARTLSPSDFGFHNALRRRDGKLTFVDFEYFGWDDPVKLTADFLWHPGMTLSGEERRKFVDGARRLYASDGSYERRLAALFPAYGLRWCLILFNEFLPSRWLRRAYAQTRLTKQQAQSRQLEKAVRVIGFIRDGAGPA